MKIKYVCENILKSGSVDMSLCSLDMESIKLAVCIVLQILALIVVFGIFLCLCLCHCLLKREKLLMSVEVSSV